MQQYISISEQIHTTIITIQAMLRKIDRLRLPLASRRDVESILVRQVSKEIDRALPWQTGHGRRTATISSLIGQVLGLAPCELHELKLAAFFHDIRILALPAHLSAGKYPLESEDYVALQNHSRLGATLLEPFSFLKEASVLIAHHHERWDGSGYPYGIMGRFIPLGSRILSIADAFDAIRIPEVLNRAARNNIALRIIRVAAGTQFDPSVVEGLAETMASHDVACIMREITSDQPVPDTPALNWELSCPTTSQAGGLTHPPETPRYHY
jgi:response regulator RpfG family c-di-GMP phosphodiesterase